MKYLSALLVIVLFLCDVSAQQEQFDGCALPEYADDPNVECGYLEVPENRSNPNGRIIKLAYLVLKARSSNPKPDPIVYLQGGPGGATLTMADYWRSNNLRYDRDFVLIDQRGTGFSGAVCTDLSQKLVEVVGMDVPPEKEFETLWNAVSYCKLEMDRIGLDQAGYNSRENAADLDDLRKALGYEKWNLFGGSYGSRLALTYMRDFPERTRSSIMTGMFPPHVDLYGNFISNFRRSLEKVFEACADDQECNADYPQLRKQYFQILKDLHKNPVSFQFQGKSFTLNPQDMLLLTHQMLYAKSTIGQIPAFTMGVKNQEERVLRSAVNQFSGRARVINIAMNWSVQAYEELPFTEVTNFQKGLEPYPEYAPGPAFFRVDNEIQKKWHSFRAEAIENEPVKSDIPSLIGNGNFDPITPPSNARATLKHLSNAFYVEFPNDGHSTYGSCLFGIIEQFLENPSRKPNSGCVNRTSGIRWR